MVILTVQLAFSPSMEWSMSRWKASHGSEHSQCASSQVSFLHILHYILFNVPLHRYHSCTFYITYFTQYERRHLIFFFSHRIVAHLTLPTCMPHSAHFVVKCRFNFFFMEYLCSLCVRASWHNLCWCIMPRWEPKKLPARRCLNLCWTLVAQFGYLCKAGRLCKGAHPENPQVRGFAEEEPTLLLARVWTNSMRGVQAWYWRTSHCLPGRESPYTFRRRTTGTFSSTF